MSVSYENKKVFSTIFGVFFLAVLAIFSVTKIVTNEPHPNVYSLNYSPKQEDIEIFHHKSDDIPPKS